MSPEEQIIALTKQIESYEVMERKPEERRILARTYLERARVFLEQKNSRSNQRH